jgi:hypothetical protein
MSGDITTQPKQGRQAVPMSSLCMSLMSMCNTFSSIQSNVKNVMFHCERCAYWLRPATKAPPLLTNIILVDMCMAVSNA